MVQRSRGFIQLEWECPQCGSRNPGPAGSCENCGAPQPDNVEFVAPAERKFVQDEKKLAHAQAGADIYCGFCETRNPATAEVCSQCGANLAEGEKRKAGGEVRQREAATTIHCYNCTAENLSTDTHCQQCGAPLAGASLKSAPVPQGAQTSPSTSDKKLKRPWIIGLILALIVCCIGGFAFFVLAPSESVSATVSDVRWETSINVQEEREVRHENERGNAPSDAYDVDCHTESQDVCTERTIDRGNGYAEVVQDCHTETEQYCSYTALEWQVVETLTRDGNDYNPFYADPSLTSGQRLSGEATALNVTFSSEKGLLDYSPSDLTEYRQYQIGSQWTLNLNRLGGIVSVER